MEVIDLFREDDTRDELGIGAIRDAFSDLLFPGTSTIQTRARYFLFVPWAFCELDRRRISGAELSDRLRKLQGKLRDALIEGGEETGVIGFRAGLNVQRLPSSVYWAGLRTWKILRFDGSEDDYARRSDGFRRRVDDVLVGDGGESLETVPQRWDPHLPEPPEGLFSETTFDLTRPEAEYLIERIQATHPQSLLTHLLINRQMIPKESEFAWDLKFQPSLPSHLMAMLHHARYFSETMHGAALLYNLLLAREKPGQEYVEHYEEELAAWADRLTALQAELETWNRTDFWHLITHRAGARILIPTRSFVDGWLPIAMNSQDRVRVSNSAAAKHFIIERERQLKRARARIGNARALELWTGSAGAAQLNYRWTRPVRDIVNDVLNPLLGRNQRA